MFEKIVSNLIAWVSFGGFLIAVLGLSTPDQFILRHESWTLFWTGSCFFIVFVANARWGKL